MQSERFNIEPKDFSETSLEIQALPREKKGFLIFKHLTLSLGRANSGFHWGDVPTLPETFQPGEEDRDTAGQGDKMGRVPGSQKVWLYSEKPITIRLWSFIL